jgi:hypothetical protein
MATAPYDSLEAVVNTARVRLNDAIQSINGDILTDTAAFTTTVINAAWRRMQELLVNYGVSVFNRETALSNISAATITDYGQKVYFNWANYYDGTTLLSAPVLPQDLISPLDLSERVHGVTTAYTPMDQCLNGLPPVAKAALNRFWEWRGETIYMPGATGTTDILLRYAGFLADFVDAGTTSFSSQPVPIMRCLDPFAFFICSEMAKARGDMDAGVFDQQAFAATEMIFNRDPRQGKSIYKRSEYGKMTGRNTPMKGPAGPRGPEEQ